MVVDLNSANARFKAGDYVDALEQYTFLLTQPNATHSRNDGTCVHFVVYLNRSSCYYSSSMFDEAIKDAVQAKSMCDTDMRVFSRLAMAYQGAGDHEQAMAACLEGLEQSPNYVGLQGILSKSQLALGRDVKYEHALPTKKSFKHIGSHSHNHNHNHNHNHDHNHQDGHDHSHEHAHSHEHGHDHEHNSVGSNIRSPSGRSSQHSNSKRSASSPISPLHKQMNCGIPSPHTCGSSQNSISESYFKTRVSDQKCRISSFFCGLV